MLMSSSSYESKLTTYRNNISNNISNIQNIFSNNISKTLETNLESIKTNLNESFDLSVENNKDLNTQMNFLKNQVNELMIEKEKNRNNMIIRETVIMFDDTIVKNIFNNPTKIKLNDIICDKNKLNKEELFKFEIFENELKCDSKDLL